MPVPGWYYGAQLGTDILGGVFGGLADSGAAARQERLMREQIAQQRMMAMMGYAQQGRGLEQGETGMANQLRKELETAPLRGRGIAGAQAFADAPRTPFKPVSMTNASVPGFAARPQDARTGGIDMAAMQQQAKAIGGDDPSKLVNTDLIKSMIAKMGFDASAVPEGPEKKSEFKAKTPQEVLDNIDPLTPEGQRTIKDLDRLFQLYAQRDDKTGKDGYTNEVAQKVIQDQIDEIERRYGISAPAAPQQARDKYGRPVDHSISADAVMRAVQELMKRRKGGTA